MGVANVVMIGVEVSAPRSVIAESVETMNGLYTLQQLQAETEDSKTIRLTLRDDPSPERSDSIKVKPVGRAFALVSSRPGRQTPPLNSELIKSKDGDEEIIKVYLKAKAENKANHEWNVSQLRNEVRHIQEARTSLKNLRKDLDVSRQTRDGQQADQVFLSEKQNGVRGFKAPWPEGKEGDQELPQDNGKSLRETAQRLYVRLQEAERLHQDDRRMYEERLSRCQQEAEESRQARKAAEETVLQLHTEIEELNRLMANMEKEQQELRRNMQEKETELNTLRVHREEASPLQGRCHELEKTVATLKEKIHHLDDMLKSQQRKVRQMIEQLQNSRTAMQEKDCVIQELREKVSVLQAENLELQDKLEHFLSVSPGPPSFTPRPHATPATPHNLKRVYIPAGSGRPFPLIKLVET